MNFEVKIRQLVSDLLVPIVEKSRADREQILKLHRVDGQNEDRIHVLEMAVYKKDPETGTNTLIEDLETKMFNLQVN